MKHKLAAYLSLTLLLSCCGGGDKSGIDQCPTPGSQSNTSNVNLVANIDPLGDQHAYSDVWAENNTAFIGTISNGGVAIVDITNPASPSLSANYLPASGTTFGDIKVQNSIAYFASLNGGGIHIVDVSNPTQPLLTSTINSSIGGFDSVHNVFVDGSHLYIVSDDPPTRTVKVFNVDDPYNPYFVRTIVAANSFLVHDITVQNNRLYISNFGGITDIFDVSAVAVQSPSLLGRFSTGINTHSNWPTEDGNYLVSAQETENGEVRIYNISDLANPQLISTINSNTIGENLTSPHNPVVSGNLLYVSWYKAGLQVFDISDPSNPALIASYDTFNQPANFPFCTYAGNWGVYPFLGTDKVLLSDIENGLFIVDITPALI